MPASAGRMESDAKNAQPARMVYASRTPTIGKRMIYNKSPVGGKGE